MLRDGREGADVAGAACAEVLLAGSDARMWFLRDSIANGDVSKAYNRQRVNEIMNHQRGKNVIGSTYGIFQMIKRLLIILPPSANANTSNETPLDERRTGFRPSSGIVSEPFNLEPTTQQMNHSVKGTAGLTCRSNHSLNSVPLRQQS